MRLTPESKPLPEYIATIRIDKRWKGSDQDFAEIRLIASRGFGVGYIFEIGEYYVIFMREREDSACFHYATKFEPSRFQEDAPIHPFSSNAEIDTFPSGRRITDSRNLRQFLTSKEPK